MPRMLRVCEHPRKKRILMKRGGKDTNRAFFSGLGQGLDEHSIMLSPQGGEPQGGGSFEAVDVGLPATNGIDALRKDLPSARLSRPKGPPEEAYAQLTRVQS